MLYIAEITAARDAAGTLTTLYLSDQGFTTQPGEEQTSADLGH